MQVSYIIMTRFRQILANRRIFVKSCHNRIMTFRKCLTLTFLIWNPRNKKNIQKSITKNIFFFDFCSKKIEKKSGKSIDFSCFVFVFFAIFFRNPMFIKMCHSSKILNGFFVIVLFWRTSHVFQNWHVVWHCEHSESIYIYKCP